MSEMVMMPGELFERACRSLNVGNATARAGIASELIHAAQTAPPPDPHAALNAAVVEAAKAVRDDVVATCKHLNLNRQTRDLVATVDALTAAQRQAADATLIQKIADMICQRPGALFEVLPDVVGAVREHDLAKS